MLKKDFEKELDILVVAEFGNLKPSCSGKFLHQFENHCFVSTFTGKKLKTKMVNRFRWHWHTNTNV